MSTSQVEHEGSVALPEIDGPETAADHAQLSSQVHPSSSAQLSAQAHPSGPAQLLSPDRLPTPLERTYALVLADRNRRNLLGRWLTLMGVTSCRTALDSTPLTSLTPMSLSELVVTEANPDEVEAQVIALRTRGWKNIVVSAETVEPHVAAAALMRDVRAVMRRGHADSTVTIAGELDSPDSVKRHEQQEQARLLAEELTSRERVVLQLVARGRTNREIGDYLKLSPLTIKSHLSRISRKLGTGDRARMVLIGMRGGAVS